MNGRVPSARVNIANKAPVDRAGRFVLYWMTASRRASWSFALDRAVDWAKELNKPLVVLETLRSGCRWASRRHHRFVLDGMADNAAAFDRAGVRYYPFVERAPAESRPLVAALADHACVVVGDDFPTIEMVAETRAAAERCKARFECVDSNGLLPMRLADRVFPTAHGFRRFVQRTLPDHLLDVPAQNPFARTRLADPCRLPGDVARRWAPVSPKSPRGDAETALPIDQAVAPAPIGGGTRAARRALEAFLAEKLPRYAGERNHPEKDATSGLSPYLHFGHVSVHEVFRELARREGWSPASLADKATGKREGWWGMSESAEAFLDELVTWREVGFNMGALRDDYDRYESLPDWARKTLDEHTSDAREYVYSLDELEGAKTHDRLWNAAQTELVRTGRIHNYLRMLWGKKILEWTASPGEALVAMIELNNKYALDGQDPNSYSGIFWVLGRYDRAWGPERPIFGKIRYMSCEATARKFRVGDYLAKHAPRR